MTKYFRVGWGEEIQRRNSVRDFDEFILFFNFAALCVIVVKSDGQRFLENLCEGSCDMNGFWVREKF